MKYNSLNFCPVAKRMGYMVIDFIAKVLIFGRALDMQPHLGARIDISDGNIIIAIDYICSTPAKVVKSMRLALRKQWSRKFVEIPLQGSVAEWSTSKLGPGKLGPGKHGPLVK